MQETPSFSWRENAAAQPRLEAGAQRRLEGVGCSRLILDIILNHAGDVFGYTPDRYSTADGGMDPRWDGRPYAVRGFHDAHGIPSLPFARLNLEQHPAAWPDGAIWPIEFQEPTVFTQQGYITNWDYELSLSTVIFLI